MVQKEANRFFVDQVVPEIYEKNEMLKSRGMCFFVIDCMYFMYFIFHFIKQSLFDSEIFSHKVGLRDFKSLVNFGVHMWIREGVMFFFLQGGTVTL